MKLAAPLLSTAFVLLSFTSFLRPARADNPIVQTDYTADPAPIVYNNRLYLFTGHDEDNATSYEMKEWLLFSTTDMANWQHHGSPMDLSTFSWASANAWAGQVVERDGNFYFYVPIRNRATDAMAIGVGVSDSIAGPFTDAIGGPLVENAQIDPTVFIDEDGQAYLYWGNPDLWYIKLNKDMISYEGGINQVELTVSGFGSRPDDSTRNTAFEEGPWLFKREDIYYMIYAAACCPENIQYSTGPSATGPWTYRGIIMPSEGSSSTNHPGIVDFEGASYFVYHNGALPGGGSFTRSVAVEAFSYNDDGAIPEMSMTTDGPPQIHSLDPYTRQEAETMAFSDGVDVEPTSEQGIAVVNINNGDYIKVKGVDFDVGASTFTAHVSSALSGGNIEIRLGSTTGELVGTCSVPNTDGWQSWIDVSCPVDGATGVHDVFFCFTGDVDTYLFNFDWWKFD